MISKLLVIGTGGSLEGEVGDDDDVIIAKESTLAKFFAKEVRLPHPVEIEVMSMCLKFSDAVTTEDIGDVMEIIGRSDASHVLVTSGTGIMGKLAEHLAHGLTAIEQNSKTIAITASRRPLVGVTPSDGGFQVGAAVTELKHLKPGVYTIFDGVVTPH